MKKKMKSCVAVVTCVALGACSQSPKSTEAVSSNNEIPVSYEIRMPASDSTSYLDQLGEKTLSSHVALLNAKQKMEKLFQFARTNPRAFFAEMRQKAPIYKIEGAEMAFLHLNKKIPNIFLVTKYNDVKTVLDNHAVFTVKPYQKMMDATLAAPYMLSNENHFSNAEKPGMREMLYGANYEARVRRIVAQLTKAAIKSGTNAQGDLDVVKSVTRNVPLMLNSDYFGFPGPDMATMAKWSRATQHSFFHNPFRDAKVDALSTQAGAEMREYIRAELLPNVKAQLSNGRQAEDVVTRLVQASAHHAKYGLKEDRIVANTMGLLVGSVETTAAAIAQSLQFIMKNPDIFNKATRAAEQNNDRLVAAFVWEALRFDPVNPWVGRYSVSDFVLNGVQIPKGSLVLAATESAQFDEDILQNPNSFRLDRDQKKLFHLGYGYHRCLGDDIAEIMVPEVVKQILLTKSLKVKDSSKSIDYKSGPFPESWILSHQPSSAQPEFNFGQTLTTAQSAAMLVGFIGWRILSSPDQDVIYSTILKTFVGSHATKIKAYDALPPLMKNAMDNLPGGPAAVADACLNGNPKSKTVFPDMADRKYYCSIRIDFRGCYFTQRLLNSKTSYQAYNHCAYKLNLLTENEKSDFKAKLSHMELFNFLNDWN